MQYVKDGTKFALLNYPTLILNINTELLEAIMKKKPTDKKPIWIRSVQHHPSNDLVV